MKMKLKFANRWLCLKLLTLWAIGLNFTAVASELPPNCDAQLNNPQASTPDPTQQTLVLVTHNQWYGLDYSRTYTMNRLETTAQAAERRQFLIEGLKQAQLSDADSSPNSLSLEIFATQEVNPVERQSAAMAAALAMQAAAFTVNVGLRAGPLSYPFFLQEGLSTLWRGQDFKVEKSETLFLSGPPSREWRLPMTNTALAIQLAERKAALILSGQWRGQQFVFVNLHLYSGYSAQGIVRRQQELKKLIDFLNTKYPEAYAIFLAGDFNCQRDDIEMDALGVNGFKDLSSDANGNDLITWDPERNPLTKRNAEINLKPAGRAFDLSTHQIDHIWVRTQNPTPHWRSKINLIYDKASDSGVWASDHFGLRLELNWID